MVFLIRLGFWAVLEGDPNRFMEPDSIGYINPAQSLLVHREFLQNVAGPATPETMRLPGYPLWLAFIFSLFGLNINIVVISQLFLFIFTLYLTFRLGTELFGINVGLAAAVLLSFDPYSFSHNFKVITETLATSLTLLLACAITAFFKNKGGNINALLVGATLTIATFVRPTTYYLLIPLLLISILYLYSAKKDFKLIVQNIVLMALPFILATGIWQARNFQISEIPYFTSLQGGEVMLTTKGAQILAAREGLSPWEARYKVKEDLHNNHPEIINLPPKELDAFYSKETMKMIVKYPWLAIETHINKLFIYFFAPGTTSELFRLFNPKFEMDEFNWHKKEDYLKSTLPKKPLFFISAALGLLFISAMYSFLFYGLFKFRSITNLKQLLWVHIALFFLIVYIANLGSLAGDQGRYRVVIMPLLSIYAAAGMMRFFYGHTIQEKKGPTSEG
ncbi:MAG: glycosyltransferase family 39 protein [Nitrospinales bacterium]